MLEDDEVINEFERIKPSHVSFIGYSAGGLITRYCLALLEEERIFENIIPVNLFLIASPNAGIYRFRSPHLFRNLHRQVYNFFTKYSKNEFLIFDFQKM